MITDNNYRPIRHGLRKFAIFTAAASFSLSKGSNIVNNKAVYTATEVACGWAGAVIKKGYSSD